MDLAALLKRYALEGTVTNEFGEAVYLGKPSTVKHKKYEYIVSWDIPKVQHNSPFKTLLIHEGRKIIRVLNVTTFRFDGAKTLSVHIQ